jgi:hypothetical protein
MFVGKGQWPFLRMQQLSGAPLGEALTLIVNFRLACKSLPGKTPAYFVNLHQENFFP